MEQGVLQRWSGVLLVVGAMAMLGSSVVGAQEPGDLRAELETHRQRQAELEERISQLEAAQREKESVLQQEIDQLREVRTEPAPTDFRASWRDGLRLTTHDNRFDMRIGGRLMFDWVWIGEDDDIRADFGRQEDGVRVRRARLGMQGTLYENIDYKLEFDFAGGTVGLTDAFIGLTDFPFGRLLMGHFKEPFGMEQLMSSNVVTFAERALPNVVTPGRNVGFMLHDTLCDQRMTWAAGVFRDTDDTGFATDDGGYNLTARLTGLPWYRDEGASLLHLGIAYSHRNPDDTVRYRARPEVSLGDRFVDTGNVPADRVDLLGLEAAWVAGPLSLQGEYIMARVDLANDGDANLDGYYAQASYFLTGERRSYRTSTGIFGGVRPRHNFRFGGGPGAWELKARYSNLDLNDAPAQGGKLSNIGAGVNWYLNPNTRVMWDYIHADVEGSGQADILIMRLQVFF